MSANTALLYLWCDNNQLTALPDLSTNIALQQLRCYNNQLTALPVLSANTALLELFCSNNQLTTLPDLSANTALQGLTCFNNQLTTLPDLSANTALQGLTCSNNQLTALPVLSANTALLYLYCYNNQLTSLPVLSANTALQRLWCYNNQLTSLPTLTNNTALQWLDCNNNKLDFSDARELRIADTISTLATYSYSPQNPFGIPDTFDLNAGDTLILSIASQDSALSYQWFRGTDTIVGATDTLLIIPNVTLADSGVYTCRSYGTALLFPSPMTFSPGISSFVSEPLLVNISGPSASISYQNNVSCNGGQDGEAAVTVTGGTPPYTLQWSDSLAQITDTAYSLFADIYYVVVTDSLGAVDTALLTITEPPAITGNQTLNICAGDSVVVGTNVYNTTGIYIDTLTASNGCDSTFTTDLTVNPLPTVSFTGLDTSYCLNDAAVTLTGTPTGGTFSGTGISSSQFNPANADTGTHTITYTYTDGNNCTDSISQNVTVNNCLGINDQSSINNDQLKVYPNPNTGEFTVTFKITEKQHINLKVFNIKGQVIYEENISGFTGKYQNKIDISGYAKGIYSLQLSTNNGIINKNIILE
ncbi:MAG: T9SS type A sorting domain-containing protein [Cytophagales bacterium]|nr:T9SS type A sorting domain-containing protein [Cytophagales bacterium]